MSRKYHEKTRKYLDTKKKSSKKLIRYREKSPEETDTIRKNPYYPIRIKKSAESDIVIHTVL